MDTSRKLNQKVAFCKFGVRFRANNRAMPSNSAGPQKEQKMEKLIKPVAIVSKTKYEVRVLVNGRNFGIEKSLVTVTRGGEITHAASLIVDKHFKENSIEALQRVVAQHEALIEMTKTEPSAFDDVEHAVKKAQKYINLFKKAIENGGVFA
jgi:hypothetical protein